MTKLNGTKSAVDQKRRLLHAGIVAAILLTVEVLSVPLVQAQPAERQQFEVASIRPNRGGPTNQGARLVRFQPLPGGRLVVENFSVLRLVMVAYGLQDFQISGGPGWVGSDTYDIDAKASGNPTVKEIAGPMLQALLQDRFKLTSHYGTKELPTYNLTIAKSGPRIQRSKQGTCISISPGAPPPGLLGPDQVPCGFRGFEQNGLDRKLKAFGTSMEELADALSKGELRRTVIDKTGLAGNFDILLHWTIELPMQASDAGELGRPSPNVVPAESGGPSIFDAIQEQSGLKLEPGKGSVKVLVIDRVERPSGN